MDVNQLADILIIAHAVLGGIALLSGFIALASRKGLKYHRTSGKVFYYSMLSSAILALVISWLPGHTSPFLFAIGIFSSYFILLGYRALRLKNTAPKLFPDKFLVLILFITSVLMIALPPILIGKIHIVLTVFGLAGLAFAIRDWKMFSKNTALGKNYLAYHLGNMIGAYIAATTAFIVVNQLLPGIYAWFTPGLIGGIYIGYWLNKLKKK